MQSNPLIDRINGRGSYWLPLFLEFLDSIKIVSKEMTEPMPMTPYGAQIRFLEQVCDGLDNNIHYFTCLKARQLGISTLGLAIDIFWLWMFPGLQGALIADTSDNKEAFRQTITTMIESLPKTLRIPVKKHNRNFLILGNGSVLHYLSAGKRKNSGLGRSRAYNFVHASECSSWGDQKGLDSLIAALAEENPNRLYMFESTALGYNVFYDMCEKAKKNPLSEKMFFIGWWGKELYAHKVGTEKYREFWEASPVFTEYENKCNKIVLEKYAYTITPEQWAWYREKAKNQSDVSLKEEYPTHEEEAFQATGRSFFPTTTIANDVAVITSSNLIPKCYHVSLGVDYTKLDITDADVGSDSIELRVWEEPNPRGKYVMGVDPATGEGETPDNSVITIWRCYADKMVQVAEYATEKPTTQQCAWVMAYLGSCYRDCLINLEITGPGSAVMAEIKHLKQLMHHGQLADFVKQIGKSTALDGIRWFLFHRVDSMGGDFSYNWRTTAQTKAPLLNKMRDAYNTGQMIARSVPLLGEMKTIVQVGAKIKGSGRNKDDRVLSAALAGWAWAEWVRPEMLAARRTWDVEQAADAAARGVQHGTEIGGLVQSQIIPNFFKSQAVARQDRALKALAERNW
ncbi:MAG: terminase family protein [Hyphomonadaceae bacterium]